MQHRACSVTSKADPQGAPSGSFVTSEQCQVLQGRKTCVEDKPAKRCSRTFLPRLLGCCWAVWDVGGGGNRDSAGVLRNGSELILAFSGSGKGSFGDGGASLQKVLPVALPWRSKMQENRGKKPDPGNIPCSSSKCKGSRAMLVNAHVSGAAVAKGEGVFVFNWVMCRWQGRAWSAAVTLGSCGEAGSAAACPLCSSWCLWRQSSPEIPQTPA